jgi:hypothetical protein
MPSASDSTIPRAGRRWLATVAVVGVVVACQMLQTPPTPRSGWNRRDWGPLVPHTKFPGDCSLCHVSGRWDELKADFRFDHLAQTGVPLEGAHERAACLRCHNDRGPVEHYVARGCGGCHVDPHEGKLGTECTQCHEQLTWRPTGLFEQHARTRFPLIGAHVATACDQCHPAAHVGTFVGAPLECEECHAAALARATAPDHLALGFTHDCQRCHWPTAWEAAHFDHSTFPLTGAHAAAKCSQCHANGVFRGTPRDCFSCHASDYSGAKNPDHAASGIGTQCQQCHTTVAWRPANFDHAAWFPIASGKHSNFLCSDCHTNSSDYSQFSCTSCHTHSKATSDGEHQGVNGYVWSSLACYSCHPNGKGG